MKKPYRPCDGNCFNCKRPAYLCTGKPKGYQYPTPYAEGTHAETVGHGDGGKNATGVSAHGKNRSVKD